MGFEQLAELRDRLRAEKQQVQQVKTESAKPQKRKQPPKAKAREPVSYTHLDVYKRQIASMW